jgi:hypothetical protein
MRMLNNRKGLAPVVATIILSGVVLIVGISAWTLTYSISSGLQTSYYEGVESQIETISERFTVEKIGYDNTTETLHVWIYNYGEVDIEVDVYVRGDVEGSNVGATSISRGAFAEITVSFGDFLSPGSELVVEVISRRQNIVYQPYIVTATQE